MFKLVVKAEFSSAHHLVDYPGDCKRVHGHNWKIYATVGSKSLNDQGMVIDLLDLESILKEIVAPLDHRLLNEVPPFDGLNPTSENIARYVYDSIADKMPPHVIVDNIKVFETDDYAVIYTGP
ncbi:6-carboxytetrahydropterin synthase QueD [candidate division KSB1 bacterium]|nr:6-carboxytetrahydropterin synthase QueD [candidate division KSB1 bacterium]